MPAIKNMHIVVKPNDAKAKALGAAIAEWLGGRGVGCLVIDNSSSDRPLSAARPGSGSPRPDLVLVLGGDGTMLSVARTLADPTVPLLGCNLGKVGFLNDLPPEGWEEGLAGILDDAPAPVERSALAFAVKRVVAGAQTVTAMGRAINDLVVNRGGLARLVDMEVFINDERLGLIRADGLIVSTPTGATGYNHSAMGPLVHPSLDCFCVTPICPFLNESRAMVLPGSSRVTIVPRTPGAQLFLTLDGQEGRELRQGDVIEVRRADIGAFFLPLPRPEGGAGTGYLAKLRGKGFFRDPLAFF